MKQTERTHLFFFLAMRSKKALIAGLSTSGLVAWDSARNQQRSALKQQTGSHTRQQRAFRSVPCQQMAQHLNITNGRAGREGTIRTQAKWLSSSLTPRTKR